MVSELRWTLLVVGAVFVVALAWWERRRRRQPGGGRERSSARDPGGEAQPHPMHEPPLTLPHMRAGEPLGSRELLGGREPVATRELPVIELPPEPQPAPVLEPSGATADASANVAADLVVDAVPDASADASADATADVIADASAASEATDDSLFSEPDAAAAPIVSTDPSVPAHAFAGVPQEALPELPPAPAPRVDWPAGEGRRILALRLVAPVPERFAGRSLRQALAAEGFVLGRFAIFHKPDEEQRAVLSAANLTRPGTFDMQTMDSQRYGGLSLFAVLPGPKPPPQAFDELVFTARNLNERLHGVLQDEEGSLLTPARVAQLREQLHAGALS